MISKHTYPILHVGIVATLLFSAHSFSCVVSNFLNFKMTDNENEPLVIKKELEKQRKLNTSINVDMELMDLELQTDSDGYQPKDDSNDSDSLESSQTEEIDNRVPESMIPGSRLQNTTDSILDVRLNPLRKNNNCIFIQDNRPNYKLYSYYILYFVLLLMALAYAGYYVWMPIIKAVITKKENFNETEQ